jgi:hypothetical protein
MIGHYEDEQLRVPPIRLLPDIPVLGTRRTIEFTSDDEIDDVNAERKVDCRYMGVGVYQRDAQNEPL